MAQEMKNKIVVLEPCTKTVEELLKTIRDRKQAELIRVSIPEEAVQLVRQFQPCMLVVCLQENNELPQRVSLFKNLESSIKYGLLKTLFVSNVKNKQIGTLITSLGVTDFMEEPVPLRTLQFKSNLQLKAVETIRKQQEMKKASQEKIVFKKNGKKEGGESPDEPQAKPTPALQLDEDSFLFKNSGVKKVGRKTVVELEGPDPASGEWVSHDDQGNAQAAWRWVPEEEKDSPEAKRGDGWVHSGDKPQFQEASRKWQMASEKPELAYQKDGKKVAKKISVNAAGEVTVAADSAKAEANIKKTREAAQKSEARKAGPKLRAEETQKESQETVKSAHTEDPQKDRAEKAGGDPTERDEFSSRDPRSKPEETPTQEAKEREKAASEEAAAPVVELKKRREQKEAKKAKGPALSPLEFLQRKKEKASKESAPEATAEAASQAREEISLPEEESAEAGKNRPSAAEEAEKARPTEKKNREEALERLRAKLGEGLEEEEALEEAIEPVFTEPLAERDTDPEEAAAETEAEEAGAEDSAPTLIGEEKPKKIRTLALPELEGLSPKERKKKVLAQVQEILAEPIPKELPIEEEKRLREKFGLEDSPETTPEALARRERLEKIKALKEGLLEWENRDAEEKAAEAKAHDLSAEEDENTWSRKNDGLDRSVARRAFDSELPLEEPEEIGRHASEIREMRKTKEAGASPYFYLPEIELTPIGNAWERAKEHQVYLSGEIRYRGFARLQDLLPLWIYEGGQKPELLDKTKQWRFDGRLPFLAKSLKEIPADVREFLLGLKKEAEELIGEAKERANQAEAAGEDPAEEADAEAIAHEPETAAEAPEKKRREAAESFDSFEKERKEEAPAAPVEPSRPSAATQADTLEEIFEKKKKGATLAEAVSESANSPGIERFLERRKKKEKAEPAAAAAKAEPTNPYLGVLVSLSNSFGPAKDSERALNRVLKSIELSFGRCTCAILGPRESDGLCALRAGTGTGKRLDPAGARPIPRSGEEEILGYLLLRPTEGRSGFSEREEEIIRKVIESIWPALARGTEGRAA
jgi:hypothetical protein